MRRVMIPAVCAAVLFLTPALILAEEEKISAATDVSFQVSSLPQAKLSVTQSFTFPFLRGSSSLTVGNNVKTAFTAEISPVSVNGIAAVTWTPLAFLELAAGGRVGSGWNMPLGKGIGLNEPIGDYDPVNPRKADISGGAFGGLMWSAWGGGALQFDLAAVVPGDWNHVVVRSYQELRYAAFTGAGPEDSWVFENDEGENRNGWVWYSSYVLGYQMPRSPVLNMVGLMSEMSRNLYNTPGGDFWGDNLGRWTFSGLFNFSITPRFNTSLILQMKTRRNHGTTDMDNRDSRWYQDLELRHGNGSRRLLFYRGALIFNYKLR